MIGSCGPMDPGGSELSSEPSGEVLPWTQPRQSDECPTGLGLVVDMGEAGEAGGQLGEDEDDDSWMQESWEELEAEAAAAAGPPARHSAGHVGDVGADLFGIEQAGVHVSNMAMRFGGVAGGGILAENVSGAFMTLHGCRGNGAYGAESTILIGECGDR